MFKSKEIRWFNKGINNSIINWFSKQGLSFEIINPRTDYYLVAIDKDDIAPKLREGNVEIKHRIGKSKKHQLLPNVVGYFEQWIKWSFKLDGNDPLSEKIINLNQNDTEWMKVEKQRMGLKLVKGKNGIIEIHNIKDFVNSGCQIEYTQIIVMNQKWYSFNLEWFREDFLNISPSFYNEVFGGSILKLEDSMGYGKFLKKLANGMSI